MMLGHFQALMTYIFEVQLDVDSCQYYNELTRKINCLHVLHKSAEN